MIVRRMQDAIGTERDVRTPAWRSVRLLLADDGMGFSFHVTTIDAGETLEMQYTNHLESVYCIEGTGTIEDLDEGVHHAIEPGVVYALDRHDRHRLRATERLVLACVFNPPLRGQEVHDASGSYPAADAFQTAAAPAGAVAGEQRP
ncbi:MAG: ectoine synthase [Myxococcota bacterium]